jgi:DNA polymerase-3 subunit epsilon/exodeoxyribonuclease X
VEGKPLFKESDFFKHLNELNNEDNYLIAHNLDFDLGMLKKEGFDNKMQLIDTLQCAKHVFEIGDEVNGYKVPNHKLQTFRYMMLSQEHEDEEAKKYGVEIKAHDAIGDVVILKLFLRELAKKVMQKYGLKNYIEIMNKMVELTNLPAKVKFMPYGQYKGKELLEIEGMKEPNKWGKPTGSSYIDWVHKDQKEKKECQDPYFNNDLLWTIEQIINNRQKNNGYKIDF